MRTVNIGQLKNRLSAYLQIVRDGEEVIVKDRNIPVARILPFEPSSFSDQEAQLVASGAMKLPDQALDWDAFFAESAGNVSREDAIRAAIDSRGDQ